MNGTYINVNLPDAEQLQYVDRLSPFDKWDNKGMLPHCAGVYFFISDGEVVYVGQSDDLCNRIKNHDKSLNKLYVTRIAFLPLKDGDNKERYLLEKAYILGYKPRHNKEID